MLLQCGIFQPVENSSNLTQLSGVPLCDLKVIHNMTAVQPPACSHNVKQIADVPSLNPQSTKRGLSDIVFVRHRMLYARAMLSSRGKIHFGLGHTHVLNRCCDIGDQEQTTHVIRYIFPRQFRLHNVFTSDIDPKDTAQSFKDYTLRDEKIAQSNHRRRITSGRKERNSEPSLPKRLRGQAMELVARMRKRHSTCSYASLLKHYCPRTSMSGNDSVGSIAQATSAAQVSAFCRSVTSKVFPGDFWGAGAVRIHNETMIMRNIDRFVRLRRYESLSLHDVLQSIKVDDVAWLKPKNGSKANRLSATDFAKRKDLIAELLYYLFDSFLIPLIRGHFHVTESGAHRNQLFYFQHDVWKAISEPALSSLKASMLEECNTSKIKSNLAQRALGISQVRLLPKEHGMRPIINLRRRVQKLQHGRLVLGKSINSLLTPTFSILNNEKGAQSEVLGSALFSVEDMYPRLQAFRNSLEQQGLAGKPLYFAKVDVKACFDTIPQKRLMALAKFILANDIYRTAKYARSKLVGGHHQESTAFSAKPSWRYLTKATAGDQSFDFSDEVDTDTINGRTRTLYVDGVVQKSERRSAILELLEEHIESNLIKLGNRLYRQKEGIPQGSIVSSLLCSYFYGELEREMLGFVHDGQSVFLRLIDDFLVISTNKDVAARFMRKMHHGIPEFGVHVKVEKSRANFEMEIDGKAIARLPSDTDFPFCGNAINTVTLDLSKDKERRKQSSKSAHIVVIELLTDSGRSPRFHKCRALQTSGSDVLSQDVEVSHASSKLSDVN